MIEKKIRIESITDLLKYSFDLDENAGSYLYRGQANHEWSLIPSVYRRFERYQAVILEAFLLYILDIQSIKKSHIYTNHAVEFLAMCQHYNIPTRLLDWSDKILTGLYFACEEIREKNGNKLYQDGALYILKKESFNKLQLKNFKKVTSEPLLVEANIVNPRMNSQSGCFMLWGSIPINPETTETYDLDEYCNLKLKNDSIIKLIIPKEKKEQFLKELDEKFQINKKSVYIDKDNHINKELEKEYQVFRKASAIITHEMINWEQNKSLFDLNINLAGCLNLQSLPENPEGFSELIENIIKYDKDLVGRNSPCVCKSGKKYKNCCGHKYCA